jgi:hypothetical protein
MKTQKRRLPFAKIGKKYLESKFGKKKTSHLFNQVKTGYNALFENRVLLRDLVLRFHEVNFMLPALALYKELLTEYGGDSQAAINDVEEVVRLTILEQTRLPFSPLRWPHRPFPLFRRGFVLVMKAFPTPAWTIDYLEKSPRRIAFNITHCFYHEQLTQLGIPELTRVFCRADDAMAEHFPPYIGYERSMTIGKGGEYCDFRYHNLAG